MTDVLTPRPHPHRGARWWTALTLLFVLAVPLIGALLVMWSVDGRMGRLDRIPAAVVNLDDPVTIGSGASQQVVPAGRQLAAGLVAPASGDAPTNLDWTLTTAADAKAGLADGSYYAVLTIPKNFSADVTSPQGDHPRQGQLRLETDEAHSAGAALLAQQVTSAATGIFNRQVTTSFLDQTFGQITTLDEQLAKAADGGTGLADGARQVSDGVTQSHDGASRLADGLGQLSGGAGQLASGASSAGNGAASLASGAAGVNSGAAGLASGAGQLAGGTGQLVTGAGQLAAGAQQTSAGAAQLAQGTSDYVAGVQQASRGADQVMAGLDNDSASAPGLSQGLGQAQSGAESLHAGLEQVSQGLDSPDPDVQAAAKAQLAQLVAGADGLATNLGTMKSGVDQKLVPGVATLQQGFTSTDPRHPGLVAGAEGLNTGAQALAQGTGQVAAGAQQLSASSRTLDSGARSLAGGSTSLAAGTSRLSSGATSLSSGVAQLSSGAGQLAGAASQAAGGSTALVSGLAQLQAGSAQVSSGADELQSGLHQAAAQVPSYSASQRKTLATVVTTPAVSHTTRHNELATTSTAILPTVVPLGLFLGAIATFLLVPALARRAVASGAPALRVAVAGWWPALAVGLAQGVLAAIAVPVFDVRIANPVAAGLVVGLSAATFAAVVQALVALFGRTGWVLSLLFLILQGVSLGGLVPLDTAPAAVQSLSGLLPVPIAADALTHTAVAGSQGPLGVRIAGLALWLAGALAVSAVVVTRRRRHGLAVLRTTAA